MEGTRSIGIASVFLAVVSALTVSLLAQTGQTFEKRHTFQGLAAGETLGRAVSGAGDVNQDGYDDVIVGAPDADPPPAPGRNLP